MLGFMWVPPSHHPPMPKADAFFRNALTLSSSSTTKMGMLTAPSTAACTGSEWPSVGSDPGEQLGLAMAAGGVEG